MQVMRMSRSALALGMVWGLAASIVARAEERAEPSFPEIKSMGFPTHWRPSVGAMFDWEREGPGSSFGGEVHASLYKDLINPATNALGVTGEGYARWVSDDSDGGARLFLSSPAAMLHLGVDYAFGTEQVDFVLSLTPAFRRSGLFGIGDNLRLDWCPARGNSLMFGFGIPLEKHMGSTRPRDKKVTLSKDKPPSPKDATALSSEVGASLQRVEHAATWIQLYTAPFLDNEISTEPDKIAELKKSLAMARGHLNEMGDRYLQGHTPPAEVLVYHQELEHAFALAGAGSEAAAVTAQARAILLDQILLPYNRLLGQRKERDSLMGNRAAAERAFGAWLETSGVTAASRPAVAQVFHQLIGIIEHCRALTLQRWKDSRLVWMALDLALRPEDHDTQSELDALLAETVDVPFSDANDVFYMRTDLFQQELARSIFMARDYHVLWIHDYRGLNGLKQPDEIGFIQTVRVYLNALTAQAQSFDQTGRFTSYFIFIDQMYYEANQGKLWLALLADPLHHQVELPERKDLEAEIQRAQEELRAAVAGSTALTAAKERHGEEWLRKQLAVHVNVTNPADVSFRSDDFAKYINFAPDLVMRDHRKIVFWDLTELDPGRGGAIFTGAGVGEHYMGPNWDDRAILVHGPAVSSLKDEARELLLSQGFKPDEVPAPFQPHSRPADYESRVEALRQQGWRTRALQVHNVTGFGPKLATVIKAAQYNLMPAGSVLFVPDSLWNSTLWGSMLFGAAMRGCQVAIVCPSQANAPSDGLPQMSRTTELFVRLITMANEFAPELAAVGGSFHAGVYDHEIGERDYAQSLRVLSERLGSQTFLKEAFPFNEDVLQSLASLADTLDARGYTALYLVDDAVARRPKLHLKVQFMATRDVIPTLATRPEWGDFIQRLILASTDQLQAGEVMLDTKVLRKAAKAPADSLVGGWWRSLSPEEREHLALYMTVGSHNQNYRSLIMDGEDLFVVSGFSSLIAYLDFARVMGLSTWITDVPTLEKLLPKPTGIGRWMRNAI